MSGDATRDYWSRRRSTGRIAPKRLVAVGRWVPIPVRIVGARYIQAHSGRSSRSRSEREQCDLKRSAVMSPLEPNDPGQDFPVSKDAPAPDPAGWPAPDSGLGLVGRSEYAYGRSPTGPKRRRGGLGVEGLVLATAVISAVISAAGTYVDVFLARPAPMPAASGRPADAQLISLTQSDAVVRVAAAVKPSVVPIMVAGVKVGRPLCR